jgi:hypothetical protein
MLAMYADAWLGGVGECPYMIYGTVRDAEATFDLFGAAN